MVALIAMIYYNFLIFVIFAAMLAIGYVYFLLTEKRRATAAHGDVIDATEARKTERAEVV